MRTIIDGLAFSKAVAHVCAPIVKGERQTIRLNATTDGLRLDADGLYYSRADLEAETIEPGEALVNGLWLKSVAAVLPNEELNVETTGTDLRLDCRGIVIKLPFLSSKVAALAPDAPDMPEDPSQWTRLPADMLARAVTAVAHSASKDSNRPILTSVRLHGTGDTLELSATDRYTAASARVECDADFDAQVPAAWLKANVDGVERILATDRILAVSGPVYTDATPMIDGEFPDLTRVWPTGEASLTLTMDRRELLVAATRMKAVQFSGGQTVRLAFDVRDDTVVLGLEDSESGSGARQTVAAQVSGMVVDGHADGADGRLLLDARYIIEACNALFGDRVEMRVSPNSRRGYLPVLLVDPDRPEGFDMRDEQLIVPIISRR